MLVHLTPAGASFLTPAKFLTSSVARAAYGAGDVVAEATAIAATAAEAGAAGAAATVALPGEVVAGGVLIVAGTIYGAYRLGGVLGAALPCFDCPPGATGNSNWNGLTVTSWDIGGTDTGQQHFDIKGTVNTSGEHAFSAQAVWANGTIYSNQGVGAPGAGSGDHFYDGGEPVEMAVTPIQGYGEHLTGAYILDYIPTRHVVAFYGMSGPAAMAAAGFAGQAPPAPGVGAPGAPTGEPLTTRGTSTCAAPGGGGHSTVTADSGSFVAGAVGTTATAYALPACPPGTVRTGGGVEVAPVDPSSPVQPTPILPPVTLPTSPPAGDPTDYSRCLEGGDSFPCALVLRHTAPPQALWDPTVDDAPTPDATTGDDPEYSCMWGPLIVPVAECAPIWQDPSNPPKTGTDPPGDPTDPAPEGCFAGMGISPLTWPQGLIISPLKCLFIPTAVTSATMTGLSADVRGRAPVSYLLDAGGFVGAALGGGNGSACFAYDVHLGQLGTFHVIDSCDANDPIVKAIRPLRPVLLVASYLALLGPLAWWAWKSYAPLSRPQG